MSSVGMSEPRPLNLETIHGCGSRGMSSSGAAVSSACHQVRLRFGGLPAMLALGSLGGIAASAAGHRRIGGRAVASAGAMSSSTARVAPPGYTSDASKSSRPLRRAHAAGVQRARRTSSGTADGLESFAD